MKPKFAILSFLLLALSIGVSGQGLRTIDKAQYDAARDGAFKKMEKVLRREVVETAKYKDQKIDTVETLTKDSFPNGDERWSSVTRRDGQPVDSFEIVYLGKYEYRKEGKADWTKRCVKDCTNSDPTGPGFSISGGKELPKLEEYLSGTTTLGGQPATVYVFYRVYQLGKYLNFLQTNTWIGSDGLILKEVTADSNIFATNIDRTDETTYAYNLKDIQPIAAPIK